MPILLKYESKDAVPEEFREEAKELTEGEDKGKFAISVVSKSKVDEFRQRNIDTSQKLEEATELLGKFKAVIGDGVELDDFQKDLNDLRDLKRRVDDGKVKDESQIDNLVKERTEAMRTKHGEELQQKAVEIAKANKERDEYKSAYKRTFVDRAVFEALGDETLGVHPAAGEELSRRAYNIFQVQDDNSLLPKKDGNTIWGEDGVTPMSVREWIDTKVRKEVPYLFKPSNGGGSKGGGADADSEFGGMSREEYQKLSPRAKLDLANKQSFKGKR